MLVRRPPPAALARWVACFWQMRGDATAPARERALPGGTMDLLFNLDADAFRHRREERDARAIALPGAIVAGAYDRYYTIERDAPRTVLGVHFRPGGAARFLDMPADRLANTHLALVDAWGVPATRLRERLVDARSTDARFTLLARALLARLAPPPAHHPAIAHAVARIDADPALATIGDVRADTGIGTRRFIDLFRATVGLTPKRYARVRRWQRVTAAIAAGARVEWSTVALDAGYCDQSHLAREFRAFAGTTPSGYRPASPERPLHVAS